MKIVAALIVIIQVVIIGLFGLTFMYVDKMEKTGCHCSVHPYRDFIRTYPIFAIIYLTISMFAPMFMKSGAFAVVMQIASFLFTIGTVIFFILAIKYVEYLIREKCKCSEDVRREMLYYWSIVHLSLIVLIVVIGLFGILISGMTLSSLASEKTLTSSYSEMGKTVRNPVKSAMSIPDRLKRMSRR